MVSNTKYRLKDTAIKKNEIIEQYELTLKNILIEHQKNKDIQLEKKKLFLKQCNSELSRNIFFTEKESNNIIKKLASD